MQILYVEDEVVDAQLVERYVRLTSHEVTIASTIAEAETAFETATPDLILIDVLINRAKLGYGFIRALRAHGYDGPIVAVTGLALAHDVEECYEAGVTDILTKPYAIQQLAAIVEKYLV